MKKTGEQITIDQLAEMIGKHFLKLENKIDSNTHEIKEARIRLGGVEKRLESVEMGLASVEERLDHLEGRLEKVEIKLDRMETRHEFQLVR